MSYTALELTLINALNRLQDSVIGNDPVAVNQAIAPELVPEQYFAFHVGAYNFLIRANCFCAVHVETPIALLPNSPHIVAGLSNIRGALIPIYQIYSLLGYQKPKKEFIFCIGKGEKTIGLLVDALPVSLMLSSQSLMNHYVAKEKVIAQLSKECFFSEEKEWHLLDGIQLGMQLLNFASKTIKQLPDEVDITKDISSVMM